MLMSFLFSVFMHRYRDISSVIRAECMEALGKWMLVATEVLLTDNYLKYVGWMLSDKDPLVRRKCLSVLVDIYTNNVLLERMQTFSLRFKERLMEMALDVDLQVRILTLRVLSQLSLHGVLDSKDIDSIADLIVDEDAEIRKLASSITSKNHTHSLISLNATSGIKSGKHYLGAFPYIH
jgi:cohesin complex subunit SA-1/2